MPVLQTGLAKSAAEDYTIDQSLRFDDGDSPSMTRTPSTTGNRRTWTLSWWEKKAFPNNGYLYSQGAAPNNNIWIGPNGTDGKLWVRETDNSGGDIFGWKTDAFYRDSGGWSHFVVAVDTTQSDSADRVKIYVNGEQQTLTAAGGGAPSLDLQTEVNNSTPIYIGNFKGGSSFKDGYLAEFFLIDGTALDASSFGETDTATNQWKPIDAKDDLTFGTNGFYQKYSSTELAASFTNDTYSGETFVPSESLTVDWLVVGGGGASGKDSGAGGGAGGFRTGASHSVSAQAYTITVGAGGRWDSTSPQSGGNSTFDTITSNGGGVGGSNPGPAGTDGGSGGGARRGATSSGGATISISPISGETTTVQGFAGGGNNNTNGSSGGGGAGQLGDTAGSGGRGGYGGFGVASSITGSSVTYGGGGGGASEGSPWGGAGGNGGGGDANMSGAGAGTSGTNGLGGGGGGGYGGQTGGSGGSGIVIISYISTTAKATGGTITSYVDGGNTYQVHTFTTVYNDHTITANGDVTNTRAQSKVGDSSIKFDGTGDYLSCAGSSDFSFTDEFTFEFWTRPTAMSGGDYPINLYDSSDKIGVYTEGTDLRVRISGSTEISGVKTLSTDTWYHVAVTRDGSDEVTLWVDGVSEGTATVTGTLGSTGGTLYVGCADTSNLFNGYLDEIRISDSARYTSDFSGSLPTTAFTADSNTKLLIHSDFDGGLGADSSGNENDFSVTNLVATDQMVDSPTNNFATLNPLLPKNTTTPTYREGNLEVEYPSSNQEGIVGTIGVSSGKWYWEVNIIEGAEHVIGVAGDNSSLIWSGGANQYLASSAVMYEESGTVYFDGSYDAGTNLAGYTVGDIMGVALNMTDSEITFYKNNSSQGTRSFGSNLTAAAFIVPAGSLYDSTDCYNFGQDSSFAGAETAQGNQDSNGIGDFYYEPPTDYLALCSSNLPSPEIALPTDHFNTVLYTGNDTDRNITGVGFQPDITVIKARSASGYSWNWMDSVRGATKSIKSNSTAAEITLPADTFQAFLSDGFELGADASNLEFNTNTTTYGSWNWLAGGTAVSNTDGDDDTMGVMVSANTTAGFSIVSYTGSGSTATVGHGLSSAPELLIVKNRTTDSTAWQCGSDALTSWLYYITLSSTAAENTNNQMWDSTAPSSSVFTVEDAGDVNTNTDEYIAYCFHSVEGYSKIFSFTGTGVNPGPFLYTGFKPAVVIGKCIGATGGWAIIDSARNTYNVAGTSLYPNTNSAGEVSTTVGLDFLSNGIKVRTTSGSYNTADTMLAIAFAESPFKYSNAR